MTMRSSISMLSLSILMILALAACGDTAPTGDGPSSESAATSESPESEPAPMTPTIADGEYYAIETRFGRMVVGLYEDTPGHTENFAKLAREDFYDGTTFHRVISGFMIQGGDPNSRDDDPMNDGQGGPGYTLEAEIKPYMMNRRGALVSARQGDQVNPERRSSGSQFYIVHGGEAIPAPMLDRMEADMRQRLGPDFSFNEEAREVYTTDGGAPWLDGQYTVFGELVEGFDVLDQIASVETGRSRGEQGPLADRPPEDIEMTVEHLPDYQPE